MSPINTAGIQFSLTNETSAILWLVVNALLIFWFLIIFVPDSHVFCMISLLSSFVFTKLPFHAPSI